MILVKESQILRKLLPLFIFLLFLLILMSIAGNSTANCPPSTEPVAESTPLVSFLQTLQKTALQSPVPKDFDPKRYVDLSLKQEFDLQTAEAAFKSFKSTDLEDFIKRYFDEAGNDLEPAEPWDFSPEPEGFLPKVKNVEVRNWALKVHSLWKNLSRKVSADVSKNPEKHTLLALPELVIIPGSRFRELCYWDSYWVIRGLLASKMYDTAKGIVINLIHLLEKYGHVLNGARAYYTNRSQPPLLSAMVHAIYKWTGDLKFVRKALPALLKEHEFWTSGFHNVTIQDIHGSHHALSRYYAMWNKPRPESSTLDLELATNISDDGVKQHLWREVASTAESGWDFSTRWMRNGTDMTTLATTLILPVDLNVLVLGIELDITFLASVTDNHSLALDFLNASQARKKAVDDVHWNEEKGQWLDCWLDNTTKGKELEKWKTCGQNQDIFASNFMPLWIESFHSDELLVNKVMKSLQNSGLVNAAGIATSLTYSGQQWDFKNGWAPLQHMIVEGLASSSSEAARAFAKEIVIKWIRTNYATFIKTGAMHEKYDVGACGGIGGGGEYVTQTGFGWSNGVVLAFLEEFGWPEDLKIDDQCG